MIDIVFALDGETLPASYPFPLWAELLRCVPEFTEQRNIGILPLRLTATVDGLLLPKRAKLVMRIPTELADQAMARLSEHELEVGGSKLQLGRGKARQIQHSPTVHAQMVAGHADEVIFMDDINTQLRALGVTGNLICGRRHALVGEQQSIQGFSLVIHDLKPEASLKLQYAGLGVARQFGFGIFIPYKVISGLNDD